MTVELLLYDDDSAREFEPFASSRPVSELLAGVCTIRERWELALGMKADGFVAGRHLMEFEEEGAPGYFGGDLPEGCIVANSRFVPALPSTASASVSREDGWDVWICAGRIAAIRLKSQASAEVLAEGTRLDRVSTAGSRSREIEGVWLDYIWDLIRYMPQQLSSDVHRVAADDAGFSHWPRSIPRRVLTRLQIGEAAAVIGENPVLVSASAGIEPYVVFDVRSGPIVVGDGAVLHSFARIEGPCMIGPSSTVNGGRISRSAIGPVCKVNGEITDSIVLGFANKAHDGFIGHSCIGRWANIGAGTITSNLKNTYGPVSLWTPRGVRNTEMQFLGTLFGDHARTAIGTMLGTGTVIGAGANLFGGSPPSRYVPPFAWGDASGRTEYDIDKFVEVARRVMSRRGITLTDRLRRHWEEVHRVSTARPRA